MAAVGTWPTSRATGVRGSSANARTVVNGNVGIVGSYVIVENMDFDLRTAARGMGISGDHLGEHHAHGRGVLELSGHGVSEDHARVLAVEVPVGATSGPLVVTNTDTATVSNAADFTILPGTYTPACTISGTVMDPGATPLANALIIAVDMAAEGFQRLDLESRRLFGQCGYLLIGFLVLELELLCH